MHFELDKQLTKLLASPTTRGALILFITVIGAIWLIRKGPTPIVRGTMALPENVPFWYMLTAFPIFGMLVADFVAYFAINNFKFKVLLFGIQIAILFFVSSFRLSVRLPISGHSMLFAFFIIYRMIIGNSLPGSSRYEIAIAGVLFIITGYVKLFQWADPLTLVLGTLLGIILASASKLY